MEITIFPKKLAGRITAPPSKSQVHRLLICAALADRPTRILLGSTCADLDATVSCLRALGAGIEYLDREIRVTPISVPPKNAVLHCGESGTTFRFLLPVAAALGVDAEFRLEGRLSQRPIAPLWQEMERMGCQLRWQDGHTVRCTGQLRPGEFALPGNVSSQFLSGLYLACCLLPGTSHISISGPLQSSSYLEMTARVLSDFGVASKDGCISGGRLRTPGTVAAQGDWSGAAFFLAANAMGSEITVEGLDPHSCQGDRVIIALLASCPAVIDVSQVPDLFPVLAVVAAATGGCVLENIQRLRLKESDRVESVLALLRSLDIRASAEEDRLQVWPGSFTGGTVDPQGDHRIAMAAAIAATVADGPVTVRGAQCVKKSYPGFWEDYGKLGGHYEQHIR